MYIKKNVAASGVLTSSLKYFNLVMVLKKAELCIIYSSFSYIKRAKLLTLLDIIFFNKLYIKGLTFLLCKCPKGSF